MRTFPKNIFLADDDADDVFIFQFALEDIGAECDLTIFSNGEELIDSLLNTAVLPDIIFIDINMPVLNGHETLKNIRQIPELSAVPVVIYSTSDNEIDVSMALANGACYYLVKPTNITALKEMIEKILVPDLAASGTLLVPEEFVMRG